MNRHEHFRLKSDGKLLQIAQCSMTARMRVDEVDLRVVAKGGDFVTAEIVSVGSIKISQPLRIDHVDRGCGVLERIDETKAGHLAEVEEGFRSCVQFLTRYPVAIESLSEVSKVIWVSLELLILAVGDENSYLRPLHGRRILSNLPELFEHPCGVDVDDEEFASTFAGPISGDDAVDVL